MKHKSLNFFKSINPYPPLFTVVFLIIMFQYSFTQLESLFYDWKIKTDFGFVHEDRFVLVTLDEESDEFLGERYPYTYVTHTRFFEKLRNENPALLGFLVALPEAEGPAEKDQIKLLRGEIEKLSSRGVAFRFGPGIDPLGIELPPSDLLDFGHSLAVVNVDSARFAEDGVSRRAILSFSGEESFHLWAANVMRKRESLDPLAPNSFMGSHYEAEADATFVNYRMATNPNDSKKPFTTIPFHQVVVGNFPQDFFKDKIVLVGSRYRSNSGDFVFTPFSKEELNTSRLSLHASLINALMWKKSVYPLPREITYALSLVMTLLLSFMISKSNPTKGLLATLTFLFGSILLGHILFSLLGFWLYTTHLVLSVFVAYYIWVPFRAIEEYQQRYAIEEESKLLKEVEGLKQNFVSLMSHDLKTPVAKIAGVADVLKQKDINDEVKDGLNIIIDSTKELNRFITSILDLTKIESRKIGLNLTSKDVNSILESVVKELEYEASSKSITIEATLAPLFPIQIDVVLVKRVLSNLVENGIKYSGEGSVIQVRSFEEGPWVVIEIEDNGVGIGPDDLKHIFDKFYRVKNDAAHRIKGTGLGLYLVKYFIELHSGEVSATSEIGKGTKFTVKLKNA